MTIWRGGWPSGSIHTLTTRNGQTARLLDLGRTDKHAASFRHLGSRRQSEESIGQDLWPLAPKAQREEEFIATSPLG